MPAIGDLGVRTYREHFGTLWNPADFAAFIERDFAQAALRESLTGSSWYLLETGGQPVGYAKVNWQRLIPVGDGVGAELQKIYFLAATAGQGHGARLLDHVLGEARGRGEPFLWLGVLKTNTGAKRFYERHAFALAGETPFAASGREHGMWVMRRDLRQHQRGE